MHVWLEYLNQINWSAIADIYIFFVLSFFPTISIHSGFLLESILKYILCHILNCILLFTFACVIFLPPFVYICLSLRSSESFLWGLMWIFWLPVPFLLNWEHLWLYTFIFRTFHSSSMRFSVETMPGNHLGWACICTLWEKPGRGHTATLYSPGQSGLPRESRLRIQGHLGGVWLSLGSPGFLPKSIHTPGSWNHPPRTLWWT